MLTPPSPRVPVLPAGPNFSFQDDDKPAKESNTADSVQSNYIHIRSQQRNGRKSLTTIQVRPSRHPKSMKQHRSERTGQPWKPRASTTRSSHILSNLFVTSQGINPKINKKVILKECKKKFNCNGTIVDDPDLGQVIQLQGDQRKVVAQFLVDEKIAKKDVIKVHGS